MSTARIGMRMLVIVIVIVIVIVAMFFVMPGFSSLNRPMLMDRSATLFFLLHVKTEDRLELVFLVHDASTAKDNSPIQQPVPTTGSSAQ